MAFSTWHMGAVCYSSSSSSIRKEIWQDTSQVPHGYCAGAWFGCRLTWIFHALCAAARVIHEAGTCAGLWWVPYRFVLCPACPILIQPSPSASFIGSWGSCHSMSWTNGLFLWLRLAVSHETSWKTPSFATPQGSYVTGISFDSRSFPRGMYLLDSSLLPRSQCF